MPAPKGQSPGANISLPLPQTGAGPPDPHGPLAEVDFLSGFMTPRDGSGPRGKHQGSAERTRAPRDGSGPRKTDQGPQEESGLCGTNQGPRNGSGSRNTNQGPRDGLGLEVSFLNPHTRKPWVDPTHVGSCGLQKLVADSHGFSRIALHCIVQARGQALWAAEIIR